MSTTAALKRAMAKKKKLTREERLKATIRKKIDKHAERKVLMDQLQTNSMSDKNRELLKASSSLGSKETNKDSINRQKKEAELNVVGLIPKEISYYKNDVDVNKKVIRPDKISDEWDDYKEPIHEKSIPIEIPQLAPETLDRLQFDKQHKTIEKRREEKSKKKFFFWKDQDVERDYDEYHDSNQDKGSYLKQQQEQDEDSEDENTIELNSTNNKKEDNITTTTTTTTTTTNTGAVEEGIKLENNIIDKKRKALPVTNNNKTNEKENVKKLKNDTTTTTTESTTSKKNKKHLQKQPLKKEEIKQDEEMEEEIEKEKVEEIVQQVNSEIDRYNLSIEVFGKQEEESREYFLREKGGIENIEEAWLNDTSSKPIEYNVFHVKVQRKPEIDAVRENLPIMMEEHSIVEKIKENDVVIICGETGSGKTTQVPQFLYESGFGHRESGDFPGIVGVTQPRRVAAVSTAKRVAEELNFEFGKEVGYQIRYDKKLDTEVNKIKFMTDGILMREVQTDFLLTGYSSILIDEAHERNLNTDILIGLLSRIVPLRKKLYLKSLSDPTAEKVYPLKLVVMSATLRVEDFTKNITLFSKPPPVINIPTRQFPVTIHFNKKTELIDYMDECYKKVVKIHKNLPSGGVLVFVTGKQEIEYLCSKLRRAYPMKAVNKSFKTEMDKITQQFKSVDQDNSIKSSSLVYGDADDFDFDDTPDDTFNQDNHDDDDGLFNDDHIDNLDVLNDNEFDVQEEVEEEEQEDEIEENEVEDEEENRVEGEEESEAEEETEQVEREEEESDNENKDDDDDDEDNFEVGEEDIITEEEKPCGPLFVLPLYSTLSTSKQMRVFQTPPLGARLVVVATNLAETSLTIPNIKYVVDTGRVKQRYYNKDNGISSFEVGWTSKASSDQRAGRAGRTGPGHCYRIFSSAVYNDHFEQFSKPEILMIPIDGMVLQMKSMGIQKITGFPFPTPPDESSLKLALRTLVNLGALAVKTFSITDLGMKMSQFPVSPRHSKMLLLGQEHNCLPYMIAIVSILTVKDPFLKEAYEVPSGEANHEEPTESTESSSATEKQMVEKEKEDRQKHLQRLRNSMRKWQHKESDLLSILKVVGAYDYQIKKSPKEIDRFCSQNFLNTKSMSEIHKLRRQLTEIVNSINQSNHELNPILNPVLNIVNPDQNIKPPTSKQELFIKQVVTAGLIDQVARVKETQSITGKNHPKHLIEYQTATTSIMNGGTSDGTCFIHPTSNLSSSSGSAEYVIYCDIIETSRPYMKLVTEINASWLPLLGGPLCSEFKPLEQPAPHYSLKHDRVRCCIKPNFGVHHWELPMLKIDHPDPMECIRYFAKALLEGEVFTPLKYLVAHLNTTPSLVVQLNTQNKVYQLVSTLKSKGISSKDKLLQEWLENPNFLYDQYLLWLNTNSVKPSILKSMWPPLDTVKINFNLIK